VTLSTTHIHRARWMRTEEPVQESMRFTAVCPRCRRQQPQQGFSRAALLRLLDDDLDIQAYCAPCRNFWPISDEERLLLIQEFGG
jgi:hypothetical protein